MISYREKQSREALVLLNPDKIKTEILPFHDLFISFRKGDYTAFIHRHFDNSDEETIITLFKGDKSLKSFAGSFDNGIEYLKNTIELCSQ